MGGGAVVAAAAAARRRRITHILDAFRVAGATAPDRARLLADLLPGPNAEFESLARDGVLVATARGDSWYLDERAYVAWREAGNSRRTRAALIAVLVALAILLGVAVSAHNAR